MQSQQLALGPAVADTSAYSASRNRPIVADDCLISFRVALRGWGFAPLLQASRHHPRSIVFSLPWLQPRRFPVPLLDCRPIRSRVSTTDDPPCHTHEPESKGRPRHRTCSCSRPPPRSLGSLGGCAPLSLTAPRRALPTSATALRLVADGDAAVVGCFPLDRDAVPSSGQPNADRRVCPCPGRFPRPARHRLGGHRRLVCPARRQKAVDPAVPLGRSSVPCRCLARGGQRRDAQ